MWLRFPPFCGVCGKGGIEYRKNQGTWPLHEVGDKAKALVVEFLEAKKHIHNPGPRRVAHWSPPPKNCYKVNFNTTLFDHLGCAGIKVVVSGGATYSSGCSQEHPDLKKKNLYIYIYIFNLY